MAGKDNVDGLIRVRTAGLPKACRCEGRYPLPIGCDEIVSLLAVWHRARYRKPARTPERRASRKKLGGEEFRWLAEGFEYPFSVDRSQTPRIRRQWPDADNPEATDATRRAAA